MRGSPSASASRAAFNTAPRAQPPPIQPATMAPSVVYQSGVGVNGAGRWNMLALVAAFAVILIPAGRVRRSKYQEAAEVSDEP